MTISLIGQCKLNCSITSKWVTHEAAHGHPIYWHCYLSIGVHWLLVSVSNITI